LLANIHVRHFELLTLEMQSVRLGAGVLGVPRPNKRFMVVV
jgi:hypothetical protein